MLPNIPVINNPDKYSDFRVSREKLEKALKICLRQIDKGINDFSPIFPMEFSKNNVYATMQNVAGWGNGFWTGILWHAYELTGNDKYKEVALSHIPSYTKRITEKIGVNHHDMGFLFTPSCVAAYKLAGNDEGKAAAIMAADHLLSRYQEKGEFIQAWGIYGPLLTYIYKKDEKAMKIFQATTNYLLNNLPSDYVAYWDLCYNDGADQPRDTSTNAIAMCGMLEGIKYMDENDPLRKIYVNAIHRMMDVLIDRHLPTEDQVSNGILLNQTYALPQGIGIDEHNIWGDYFFMEALHRMLDPDWNLYW